MEEIKVERICLKCGEVNEVSAENMKKVDTWTEDGEYLRICYISCSRCKEKIFLQVDNMETINEFKELRDLTIKAARMRLKGQTVGKKMFRKKDRLSKDLRVKRMQLEEVNSGKILYDKNKKVFTNCLTFPKVGDIIENKM